MDAAAVSFLQWYLETVQDLLVPPDAVIDERR